MGAWPYWAFFFALGLSLFLVARRLDDQERSSGARGSTREGPKGDLPPPDEQT